MRETKKNTNKKRKKKKGVWRPLVMALVVGAELPPRMPMSRTAVRNVGGDLVI
jgi:hypothetical protein